MKKIIFGLMILSICSINLLYAQRNVPITSLAGVFENNNGNKIELMPINHGQMYIVGMVITSSGNIGEIDFVVGYHDTNLFVYEDTDSNYVFSIKVIDENTIEVIEENVGSMHGMGVSFDGTWKKVR